MQDKHTTAAYVATLTDAQRDRLYRRVYNSIADCFGADWRTIEIVRPGAAIVLRALLSA